MHVAIAGGGIVGLSLAMHLHERGVSCTVYERVPDVKELGVGITLLPHAMRELATLGVDRQLQAAGIENLESCFYNRFGQLIYKEPRGRYAGYDHPEIGIHRGRLHLILLNAARERLGSERILTDRDVTGFRQDDRGVVITLRQTSTGAPLPEDRADALVACDGINSVIRALLYPQDKVAFAGINTWRGVTRHKPILTGRSYLRIGSIKTGKLVVYPIIDNVDGEGAQLINWMAEIQRDAFDRNDWNATGRLEDFYPIYRDWTFDWLDVGALISNADQILEYPMVDKDPVERWTFGRVTLAGDAAHAMYPRGSNGAAQGSIDARTLADCFAREGEAAAALKAYDAARVAPASKVVLTNRSNPPDSINIKVEELVGDQPFDDLDAYISQDELRRLSDSYKQIAGFALR